MEADPGDLAAAARTLRELRLGGWASEEPGTGSVWRRALHLYPNAVAAPGQSRLIDVARQFDYHHPDSVLANFKSFCNFSAMKKAATGRSADVTMGGLPNNHICLP